MNQLAALALNRLAPGTKARYADAQLGELRFSVANVDAARRAFGFSPAGSLERNLDEVVDAVKAMTDASGATPRST